MGRLRTNINAPILIKEYKNYKDLSALPLSSKIIHLEIGSGKGDFLIQQAVNNPKTSYIGVEKYSTVILKALKKIVRDNIKLNNLYFCCADAKELNAERFKHIFEKIYLNFSDPWPKKRHAKRRLTSTAFLDLYKYIIKPKSIVEFKTDNKSLYEFTIETLCSRKDIRLIYKTTNLYKNLSSKFNKSNVQTEYEKKFVLAKKKIYKVIWQYV